MPTSRMPDGVVLDVTDKRMIITRNGITIQMEVEGIRKAGRSTQQVQFG